MIVKFSDGTVCRVDEGINNVELINRFKSLHYISNKTKLLTNDYQKELLFSSHVVFVNDFVTDDWIFNYNLLLEKLVVQKLLDDPNQSELQRDLDLVMNQLSEKLLMLDLPVKYERNLQFDLNLVKYFRLKQQNVVSAQELFGQLLHIHSRVCPGKILMLNHLDDYDVDLDEQQIKDLHLKLVILN